MLSQHQGSPHDLIACGPPPLIVLTSAPGCSVRASCLARCAPRDPHAGGGCLSTPSTAGCTLSSLLLV